MTTGISVPLQSTQVLDLYQTAKARNSLTESDIIPTTNLQLHPTYYSQSNIFNQFSLFAELATVDSELDSYLYSRCLCRDVHAWRFNETVFLHEVIPWRLL
jgi:hypothetical protein